MGQIWCHRNSSNRCTHSSGSDIQYTREKEVDVKLTCRVGGYSRVERGGWGGEGKGEHKTGVFFRHGLLTGGYYNP